MRFLKYTPVFFILLLVDVIDTFAQDGDYFLSHHQPKGEGIDNVNFDLTVGDNGLLYIANRSGVLVYEGKSWDFYETPSAALSIAIDSLNNIYVGCVDNYGKVSLTGNEYKFNTLADSSTNGLFFKTLIYNNKTYFLSEQQLIIYDLSNESREVIQDKDGSTVFTNIFVLGDELYLQTPLFVYTLDGGTNLQPSDFILPDSSLVSFITSKGDNHLIGSEFNNLFTIKHGAYKPLASDSYIKENQIQVIDGGWVNDDIFALSTLENGCLLFSSSRDTLIDVIDYNAGLPDNEVFSIEADNAEGLWISHEFGLSRLAPALPIRSFSNYPGLEGNLLSVADFQDQIYIASSKGVYMFSEEKEYKNTVYYTKVERRNQGYRAKKKAEKKEITENEPPLKTEDKESAQLKVVSTEKNEKKKKGFFGRLKDKVTNQKKQEDKNSDSGEEKDKAENVDDKSNGGVFGFLKKDDKEEEETENKSGLTTSMKRTDNEGAEHEETIDETNRKQRKGFFKRLIIKLSDKEEEDKKTSEPIFKGRPEKNVQYKRNVKRELISTNYHFEAVEGVWSKCKQFIIYKDKLLAACNSGIFNIKEEAELIIDVPVRNMQQFGDQLFINTFSNQILVFELIDNIWALVGEIDLYGDIILTLFEDSKSVLWAASPTTLYKMDTSKTAVVGEYEIPNQYIDNIRITEIRDQIYLINNQGYFYLDSERDEIVSNDEYYQRIGRPVRHLQQNDGETWIYNGKTWQTINKNGSVEVLEHLTLFPEMTFIDQFKDFYWAINQSKQLYKVDLNLNDSLSFFDKMIIKNVSHQNGHVKMSDNLVLDYDENRLTFELARPDYLGLLQVEYQYRMEGLNNNWSDWSTNNKLVFNYLPPNKYTLHVRSRDSFGRIIQNQPVTFRIKPPYWNTVWFSLLQVLLFSGLIIFSIWLNRKKKSKYTLLTDILTVFTIVLVIEFLQSLVQNTLNFKSSPGVDFLIDASIAFIIFPLEHFLRMFVKEGSPGNIPFFPGDRFWQKVGLITKEK